MERNVSGPAAEFRLDGLIPGDENILAISGAARVLEEPGDRLNPLVIFGPPGVGKTHLLFALRNEFEARQPKWNILALPAGEFLEECENAWQNHLTGEFRQMLWRLDLLVIDDIHLLINRPAALEELYHLFNRLVADGKQLVFSSRVPPRELLDLPAPLRSRLQSGLAVGIEPARDQLLHDVAAITAARIGIRLTRRATRYLAREVRDVRELQGILQQVSQLGNGRLGRVTLEHIREFVDRQEYSPTTIADVAQAVCNYFRVDLPQVRSPCRQQSLVQARQLAMYLAREFTSAPLTEIGAFFGGRDHSTVLYAYRKVSDEVRQCGFAARAARDIEAVLRP